eukprot:5274734-Pyramimonas_sp.AAC.1
MGSDIGGRAWLNSFPIWIVHCIDVLVLWEWLPFSPLTLCAPLRPAHGIYGVRTGPSEGPPPPLTPPHLASLGAFKLASTNIENKHVTSPPQPLLPLPPPTPPPPPPPHHHHHHHHHSSSSSSSTLHPSPSHHPL